MAEQKNRIRWPDGAYVSFAPSLLGVVSPRVSGTWYWNPGSESSPPVTVTGGLAVGHNVKKFGPGLSAGVTYLEDGMTSADTLGYGTSTSVSAMGPSVTVNSSMPDTNYVPQFGRNKLSSKEVGIDASVGASTSGTITATPQQIFEALIPPAMGPNDELSPFARTLRSGVGSVGEANKPPVRYLGSRYANPLGGGMDDWKASADVANPPAMSLPPPQEPGGLLGLLQDYLRNNPEFQP